jgi:protein-serine/threonine kinase
LVHASDADQLEALLTRWGPDRQGKLGGAYPRLILQCLYTIFTLPSDPKWANPIKNLVRQQTQARAVNEVVNALKPSVTGTPTSGQPPPLRVVNGMPTPTNSSVLTPNIDTLRSGLPPMSSPPLNGGPGNSTIRWGNGLPVHAEHEGEDADANTDETALLHKAVEEVPRARKPIVPSLATLEKAVAARIFFENLYFPLLRQPPSREQRRLAMERDMMNMQLSDYHKEQLRAKWRQNESDYLRERRRKVDPSAFKVLKTIGHGACRNCRRIRITM